MMGALVYLQLTTLKNAMRARLQRLRQPKYLLGALVAVAYFYFFFFQSGGALHDPMPGSPPAADQLEFLEPLGAFLLFGALALAWILPNSRAALAFTEAEVAFLFSAPVTRRTLVHFKLIKSQLGILFSSLLLTVISNRWTFLGGSMWMHAVGWWLIFSLFNLHLLGASFARQRLLDFGVDARWRRIVAGGVLVGIGLMTWFWLGRALSAPGEVDFSSVEAMGEYAKIVLSAPPLGWVLWPFRLVVRPFLAADAAAFIAALWPVLLLLVGHYCWVVRSEVAFEEASVELSKKRAETITAMREGKWSSRKLTKKRREPFALSARGEPSVAFLWKGLIAGGPIYYPKNWLVLGLVLAGGVSWFGRDLVYEPVLKAVGIFSAVLMVYGLFLGPMIVRRGAGQMLVRFDVYKTYPVQGWQVVLGELLCPVTILCLFEWVLLGALVLSVGFDGRGGELTFGEVGAWAVGVGVTLVPLVGLLFTLNFAGILYFPAWLSGSEQGGAGMERIGQRLIFFVVYLVVLLGALLPALVLGAVPFALVRLFSEQHVLAIAVGSGVVFAVLAVEFALAIWWLGRRFERFDLSVELPQS